MKILFVTDIHGCFEGFRHLPAADYLLLGGDFVNLDDSSSAKLRSAIFAIEAIYPKFWSVSGNLDPRESDEILAETGHWIPKDTPIELGGVKILGLGGANRGPVPTPNQWDDGEMATQLERISAETVDILVTHAPPFQISGTDVIPNGMHVGSRAVVDWAKRLSPKVHLCGHIHEGVGAFDYKGTPIVNPGPIGKEGNCALIEVENGAYHVTVIRPC